MGCTNSKLDDLPAVALCRERCAFLDEAIHQRYALAEAHLAYTHSLKAIGHSLHRFFDQDLDAQPLSPVLNLPNTKKGAHAEPAKTEPSGSPPQKLKAPAASSSSAADKSIFHDHHHSHSNSAGSHLDFPSDSDDDDDDGHHHLHSGSDSFHHHHHDDDEMPSPVHNPYGHYGYPDHDNLGVAGAGYGGSGYPFGYGGGGGGYTVNYMRNHTTQSVTYEQRPMNPEIVTMGEASSSYYNPYPYPENGGNPSTSYNNYSYYNNYSNDGGSGGYFGASYLPQRPYGVSSPPMAMGMGAGASTSKPPPPPPSPPRSSAWDFLNPFETFVDKYEKYYPPYTPSRDSREVREEEGIPDLEDEDYQQEVVKEVHGDQKFVEGDNYSKAAVEDEGGKVNDPEVMYRTTRPSVSMESDQPVEYDVHVVDKKVVDDEDKTGDRVAGFKARGFRDDSDVIREIQLQFDRASESGNELAKVLEVGKLPYNRKHAAYQVSSKMLHVITPSLPSTSKSAAIENPAILDIEEDMGLRSKNLSSTLQKLHLWEKKLYEEVKVEEKMRVLHERKSRKLKRLDERGAEAQKVDTTRKLVRSLSTKIRIAIQVVDKISVKINKLRDEELWPQINEFIQGLARMWKSMLECHQNQCQAIGEAKRLDAIASHKQFSDAHLEATLQLEHELLNWTLRFSCWVNAQKGYVRALNNWLMKCLLYVPEETPDGIAPFSPGRIGAPPVFVICNQWFQSLEGVSERDVLNAMRGFAISVLHLWDRDKLEMRQRMMANKDTERKLKNLEREDQKIQKEIQAIDKRIVLFSGDDSGLSLSGNVVYQTDTHKSSSLQVRLQHLFEAMERFTADSLKVYEGLLQRIEEDYPAPDHARNTMT